jgi:hypothetical protein
MVLWRMNTWTVLQDKVEQHDHVWKKLMKKLQPYAPEKQWTYFQIRNGKRVKRGLITKGYQDLAEWEASIHAYDSDEEIRQLFQEWYACHDQSSFHLEFWEEIPVDSAD